METTRHKSESPKKGTEKTSNGESSEHLPADKSSCSTSVCHYGNVLCRVCPIYGKKRSALPYRHKSYPTDLMLIGGLSSSGVVLKAAERYSWKTKKWSRLPKTSCAYIAPIVRTYRESGVCLLKPFSDHYIVEQFRIENGKLGWKCYRIEEKCHFCPSPIVLSFGNHTRVECSCGLHAETIHLCDSTQPAGKKGCDCISYRADLQKYLASVTDACAVSFGLFVLIFSGVPIESTYENPLPPLKTVKMVNMRNNEISSLPDLPYAVTSAACTRLGNCAVLIGGIVDGSISNNVLVYNSITYEISCLPPVNYPRALGEALSVGNNIVAWGGFTGGGHENDKLRHIECLTVGNESWKVLPQPCIPRSLAAVTTMPVLYKK